MSDLQNLEGRIEDMERWQEETMKVVAEHAQRIAELEKQVRDLKAEPDARISRLEVNLAELLFREFERGGPK